MNSLILSDLWNYKDTESSIFKGSSIVLTLYYLQSFEKALSDFPTLKDIR